MKKIYLEKKNSHYINGAELFIEDSRWIFSDDVHFVDNKGYEVIIDKIVNIISKKLKNKVFNLSNKNIIKRFIKFTFGSDISVLCFL